MSAELLIRPAMVSDVDCLSTLEIQTWLHTYATTGIRPTIARYVREELSPAAVLGRLERLDAFTLVAEVDGHLIGFARVEIDKPCPAAPSTTNHLDKLFVQEHFFGRGIGQDLLMQARQEARYQTGNAALWLTVNSGNENARFFYTKQGFMEVGITEFDLYGEKHENRILLAADPDA